MIGSLIPIIISVLILMNILVYQYWYILLVFQNLYTLLVNQYWYTNIDILILVYQKCITILVHQYKYINIGIPMIHSSKKMKKIPDLNLAS